jgi:DNA mismatch repair protein MutS2
VLPVKAECRASVPGLIHEPVRQRATLYRTHGGGGSRKRPQAVGGEEEKEIERILAQLSAEVAPDAAFIANNLNILAELDVTLPRPFWAGGCGRWNPSSTPRGG